MCEKIAQLTKVVSNLQSETEDAREQEKELNEEHVNVIELCRADGAAKILETHARWREEVSEKERFERMASSLEEKTMKMKRIIDGELNKVIRQESKTKALNEKMEELESVFKQSHHTQTKCLNESNENLRKETETRQTLQQYKIKIEREKCALEIKVKNVERSGEILVTDFERKAVELEQLNRDFEEKFLRTPDCGERA